MRRTGFVCALALMMGVSLSGVSAQSQETGVLYTVSLKTGALVRVGAIGDGTPIAGLAISAAAPNMLHALTEDGRLLRFSPDAPAEVLADVGISGLGYGEVLLGIDVRPATGELVGVSDASTLYDLDPETGAATALGEPFSPAIDGDVVGFDFNPTVDRIRLVTNNGQNLRLNPETGQVGVNPDTDKPTIDSMVAYAETDPNAGKMAAPQGAGYTNSVADAESTQLYVIDLSNGTLAVQDPPNDGILNTVGALTFTLDSTVSFDIAPSGAAYAAR